MITRRAVVLLSGGLDSATAAAWAKAAGFDVSALSVDYGQRHRLELEAARRVAERLGIRTTGSSRWTCARSAARRSRRHRRAQGPRGRSAADIPVTYVPARNTVFLALLTGGKKARLPKLLPLVSGLGKDAGGSAEQDKKGFPHAPHANAQIALAKHMGTAHFRRPLESGRSSAW